jgi:hypothetical protein
MSRLFDDGATDFAEVGSTPITGVPVTLACWFYSDDVTAGQCLMGIFDASVADHYIRLEAAGARAGDPVIIRTKAGAAAAAFAESSSGFTANTWHLACGVSSAVDTHAAYIDGANKGTDATSRTPANLDTISVGRSGDSTPSLYMSGRIAWGAIWNAALSDAEVAALAGGILPWKIRAGNLQACYPLWGLHSPEVDLVSNGYPLTLTGTVRADDPPVSPFSMRMRGQAPMRSWPYLHPRGLRAGAMELVGGMH